MLHHSTVLHMYTYLDPLLVAVVYLFSSFQGVIDIHVFGPDLV